MNEETKNLIPEEQSSVVETYQVPEKGVIPWGTEQRKDQKETKQGDDQIGSSSDK